MFKVFLSEGFRVVHCPEVKSATPSLALLFLFALLSARINRFYGVLSYIFNKNSIRDDR